jgi:4Fe-4S ferredoxin
MAKPLTAENCDADAGKLQPVVDMTKCEGKEDCLRVCPYNVFTLRPPTADEKEGLSLITRFKIMVHGGKQAFVERPADCHACGLCVQACPEKAIKLISPSRA